MSDKLRLDPKLLTPRDMQRAKVALGGRNPYELLEDVAEAVPLLIFCQRSRDDPEFTYADALDVPFGDFEIVDDEDSDEKPPPSPTAPPAKPGGSGAKPGSRTARTERPSPSSAASTASASTPMSG